jgi:hypothetical protein
MAGDDPMRWRAGLVAYQSVRPLSPDEKALVVAYDRSGLLLGAANWMIRWLVFERRSFPDKTAVNSRLHELAERLRCLRPTPADHPVFLAGM